MSRLEVAMRRDGGADPAVVMAEVARVFHDRIPRLVGSSARQLFFELVPVHEARPSQDPDLAEQAQRLLGLNAADIAPWRRLEDHPEQGRRWALMLEHCHALEAWCDAPLLQAQQRPTLLLHLDAHDDLNAPSLLPGADRRSFRAPIGPDRMRLDDRKTVRRFVARGYIGIGGFIAPMLAAGAIDAMLHVCAPGGAGAGEVATLVPEAAADSGWLRIDKRPADQPGVPYRRVDLATALALALGFDGHLLLDIDFDGFCNRFDTEGGAAASDAEALAAMDQALRALLASGLARRAAVTTLALSPGFFPAALWPAAVNFAEALRGEALG